MLTTLEVCIYASVLFLFPLIVYSIANGSPPPPNTWLARYYRIEKHLMLAGNVFMLSVCFMAAVRLALHFGLIDPNLTDRMNWVANVSFMFLFFVYVAMWIRAALKVRRAEKPRV